MSKFDCLRDSLVKGDCSCEIKKLFGDGNPLFEALKQGVDCPLDVVKLLLDEGADVNYADEDGVSCLHLAIMFSTDEAIILELFARGADVNKSDKCGRAPLKMLLQRENCSALVVRLWIRLGGWVSDLDEYISPLMTAICYGRNEEVIRVLLEEGARKRNDEYPITSILWSKKCSVSFLKLLLDYFGDEVNYREDQDGQTPLEIAISRSMGKDIIRALLDKGAQKDALDEDNRSLLCIAFECASNDVIQMMLDVGFSPKACLYHESPLFCALSSSQWELKEDILDCLLKEQDTDLNSQRYVQSLFCAALQNRDKLQDLDLLLTKGLSMNACQRHRSPLICATFGGVLREDKVKWLLDRGACIEDNGWDILERALRECQYEIGAIQLLLNLPGMMDCITKGKEGRKSILHFAVGNPYCTLEAVELLLSRISDVHRIIKGGETLLHRAIENAKCPISIVKLLLRSGFPVNKVNEKGNTPLGVVIINYPDSIMSKRSFYELIKELLIGGAMIGEERCCDGFSLLHNFLRQYVDHDIRIMCNKLLELVMKFFFLQNPHFDFEDCKRVMNANEMCEEYLNLEEMKQFANDCLKEIKELGSFHIGDGFTLCELGRGYCLSSTPSHDCTEIEEKNLKLKQFLQSMTESFSSEISSDHNTIVKNIHLVQLLTILANNDFKVYLEVFSGRLERAVMEKILLKLNVYSSEKDSDTKKIYLNEDVLFKISTFLCDEDLLRFILAFYNINSNYTRMLQVKRSLESTSKLNKFPKLY